METKTKSALALKLAKILGDVGKVPKSGHNSFHNYDYVTENDLVYAVRSKLADAGIFVFTSIESQTNQIIESVNKQGETSKTLLTSITTKHTFVDGDTGEEFSVLSQGQGADNGDKGGYKAITGAMKYFLYKCFMIPTGDDPERDEDMDKRTSGSTGSAERLAPAPARSPSASAPASRSSPSVPRDPGVDDITKLRAQFEGGKWHTAQIHFGNDKGKKLFEMESKKLAWWIENYRPEPFKGKMNPDDLALRAALDVADVEWK